MNLPPLRAWFLVILSSLFLLSISFITGGRWGLMVGLLMTLSWSYGMLLKKHKSSLEHYKAIPLEGRDPWSLNATLKTMARDLNHPLPKLYLTPTRYPLLLISNSQWSEPQIMISQGLIKLVHPEELEALMALALISLKNKRSFWIYTLTRMAQTWIAAGLGLDHGLERLFRHSSIEIFTRFIYPVAWLHLRAAYTKKLQSQSDLETSQYLKASRPLASALWKTQGYLDSHPIVLSRLYRHESLLGTPRSRRTAAQFILPIEHRLHSLVGYYPI